MRSNDEKGNRQRRWRMRRGMRRGRVRRRMRWMDRNYEEEESVKGVEKEVEVK